MGATPWKGPWNGPLVIWIRCVIVSNYIDSSVITIDSNNDINNSNNPVYITINVNISINNSSPNITIINIDINVDPNNITKNSSNTIDTKNSSNTHVTSTNSINTSSPSIDTSVTATQCHPAPAPAGAVTLLQVAPTYKVVTHLHPVGAFTYW